MVTRLLTVQRGAAADAGSEAGAPGQGEVAFPSLSAIGPGPEALPGVNRAGACADDPQVVPTSRMWHCRLLF